MSQKSTTRLTVVFALLGLLTFGLGRNGVLPAALSGPAIVVCFLCFLACAVSIYFTAVAYSRTKHRRDSRTSA